MKTFRQKDLEQKKGKKAYRMRVQEEEERENDITEYMQNTESDCPTHDCDGDCYNCDYSEYPTEEEEAYLDWYESQDADK